MKILIRPSDAAKRLSIDRLEVNKKYEILHEQRVRTTTRPIIFLNIQYSEDETHCISLTERCSGISSNYIIDIINTSSIRTYLVFEGFDESTQYFVLGFE
jgi:hypothetical protein